ncbi:shikimate kinase [Tomitella gaofuii]|uniref:shikimate kinase n=1 Tax=Tomitella gaofuii TaxID=2760083 RepID=UPI0015F9A72C|nr:shikimate kinase [Tomitella gaofuii]
MAPRAVMVGPPGAGKSTIGRRLAAALGVGIVDTDAEVERREGRPIREIFAADGEDAFRGIEEDVVRESLQSSDGVVSLGGGAVLSARTRALLRGHTVVFLDISAHEGLLRTGIAGRLRGQPGKDDETRPLLWGDDPAGRYRALIGERRPLYEEVATLVVHTDRRSPGKVVREIAALLGSSATDASGGPGGGGGTHDEQHHEIPGGRR